jgi:NNP family nitrate/nitrite transporter-like MFS transporter
MSDTEPEAQTAIIGRGASVLVPQKPADGDIESPKDVEAEIAAIKESQGWVFPKVKLAAWNPEDEKQWEATGKFIAKRNLIASIPNLTCAFGVWLVWSVIATRIQKMHDADANLYPFQDWGSPEGKQYRSTLFLLPAVAGLSGGTLRIPNSFLTQVSGGRNVVYNTSILLCIPMLMAGIGLSNPNCPFNFLIAAALLSGVGGGAFASSMSNISFYYPKRLQGMALGYNGGIGNLGVSISQLLAPLVMAAGASPLADSTVKGWPANAGWLWFPLCATSAILAFFFMSNQPNHGEKSSIVSVINFYWMEAFGFLASFIGAITLIQTRDAKMLSTPGGQVIHKFLLVILACVCEHFFMMLSPKRARDRVKTQAVIFKRKHTYIMTWLYIMCFGSFIGYSGSFPKLIVDLFGYLTGDGCLQTAGSFVVEGVDGMSQDTCDGEWKTGYDYPNPNAPNGASVAWLGAFVGSLIRPVGGIMADKYGGAKMTNFAIIWCTIAAFGQGALVQQISKMDDPTSNNAYYGLFIFLFINLFACCGFMNGTTFRTIGVLFPPEESGAVLGWSSAIASYGAFIIPTMFGIALKAGNPQITFYGLGAYYVTCFLLNFWYYLRPGCEKPGV